MCRIFFASNVLRVCCSHKRFILSMSIAGAIGSCKGFNRGDSDKYQQNCIGFTGTYAGNSQPETNSPLPHQEAQGRRSNTSEPGSGTNRKSVFGMFGMLIGVE